MGSDVKKQERRCFGMSEVFAVREEGKVAVIDLLSELDRLSVLSIKTQLRGLITKKRKNKFVINFDKIDYINSTIVGALVGIQHLARERNGEVVLCCVKPNIRRTFDLIGASKILKICDTEAEALESLQ